MRKIKTSDTICNSGEVLDDCHEESQQTLKVNINNYFLSRLCILKLPNDTNNLNSTSKRTKRIVLAICTIASICSPFQTSIILPAISEIKDYYNTTSGKVNDSVGVYLLALGIFPLYHSSLSEKFGKRPVYIFAFLGFSIMCLLGCVASPTIDSFIGIRFLCGGFGSCVQTLGIGSVADLYEPDERGFAIGIFYLGSLTAPLAAPIIGAILCDFLGWKSTQWFMLGLSFVVLVTVILFLPETSIKAIYRFQNRETKHVTNRFNIFRFLINYFINPWKILIFLSYPPFLISCLSASVASAMVYYSNIILATKLLMDPYKFKEVYVGLCYLPISVGFVIAAIIGGRYVDNRIKKYKENNNGILSPQARLSYNIVVAVILLPIGMLLEGWSFEYNVIWPVPLIGSFFLGAGSMLFIGAVSSYLTDEFDGSSKGVALNNLCRQSSNAVACFTTVKATKNMGIGYFCVLISSISVISGSLVLIFKKKKEPFNKEKVFDLYNKI
ncbi:hypothetical protein QEN19_000996 [Hanseniaspora menglaensis]